MRLRRAAIIVLIAAVALVGASSQGSEARGSNRLIAFRSCGDMLGYVRGQASRLVGPYGLGGVPVSAKGIPVATPTGTPARAGSAPQEGVDYSGTNVQEAGVDEPDMVKTDGSTLFAASNGRLNAVDVAGRRPALLDSLKIEGWSNELLLSGDRLVVVSRGGFWAEPLPGVAARLMPYQPSKSVLTEVDVSNPKALRVVRTLTLDGAYVTARLVGSVVRIVATAQVPGDLPFESPASSTDDALAAARAHNEAVVASSSLSSWLPTYRVQRAGRPAGKARPLVQCRRITRPPVFSGLGMLTVLTVDLKKGLEPVDSTAVMTDARIVYASPQNLYVATERWAERPDPATPNVAKSNVTTEIHRFDISSPTRTQYRGSGSVDGFLLSQWSLSEYRGVLRVVSTDAPAWWGPGADSESFLTTLRAEPGALVQAARLGGLGKGERVYAVRFTGDVGYVVTFRQIDPLYTLDLADATRPRVLGELKVAGYSAYLHPIGDDLLLGVGQDVSDEGRPLGTHLSLFDVSDLRRPTRLAAKSLGPGWSQAEADHHAFLYWPRTGLVVLPFQQEAAAFRVARASRINELGRIHHPAAGSILRSLVVGDSLLTVSSAGVESNDLATLANEGWAAFPAAPSPEPVPR
jgi:uncharacterized secreted protein with C-terminal beta-propeller domain